ncbi:MAG: outer membrane protein assembly factor BamD [Deltaproteobacteria bacterium]|nr:outer membrane protein assembly factor BamD [Deltaproteobacteria bacterium]
MLMVCACGNATTSSGGADAFQQYDEAMAKLIKGSYTDAAAQFEEIAGTTLSPLLSQLATLRLGDSLFLDGRHAEAAEVYREFQEQYASSPDVPHAVYMRGLCYLRRMPEDHWALPPAESREMTDVESAYESFTWVIRNRPESYYAPRSGGSCWPGRWSASAAITSTLLPTTAARGTPPGWSSAWSRRWKRTSSR